MLRIVILCSLLLLTISQLMTACSQFKGEGLLQNDADHLISVSIMLDWVPNTHHIGIFVAQDKGYFEKNGLKVDIIEVDDVYAEQAVISGQAEFGISFQDMVTFLRSSANAPLVSIAAILQHNTTGFAVLEDTDADSPGDWDSLTYSAFGTPFESPTLEALMECSGGDFSRLNILDVGYFDPLTLLEAGYVQLAWISYGVEGIQAEQRGLNLNVVMMEDYFDCIPDYYSPVIVASEAMIAENPDTVKAFLAGLSLGYEYAITHPEEASEIMLDAAPFQNEVYILKGLEWLTPYFVTGDHEWGVQELAVWQAYGDWMIEKEIIETFDAELAFTNEFLPADRANNSTSTK